MKDDRINSLSNFLVSEGIVVHPWTTSNIEFHYTHHDDGNITVTKSETVLVDDIPRFPKCRLYNNKAEILHWLKSQSHKNILIKDVDSHSAIDYTTFKNITNKTITYDSW